MVQGVDDDRVLELLTSCSLDLARRRTLLLDLLATLERSFVDSQSREQGSHFKWYLGELNGQGAGRVWLHEFKAPQQQGMGYARTIHNHRYDLEVWIVAGGYRHEKFSLPADQDYFDEAAICRGLTHSSHLGPGSYYALRHNEFHALSQIEPATFTIVAEHPAVKPASMSLNRTGGRWVTHTPVDLRFTEMQGIVKNALAVEFDSRMQLDGER